MTATGAGVGPRARAMGARLAATAERLGVGAEGRALMAAAFDAGMEPRARAGLDDHAPDYLHTARTALILMDDATVADPVSLAAALVTETRDPALRPSGSAIAALGEAVVERVRAVPDPREEGVLLERLVAAPLPVLMLTLAERLDHARHLHLRPPEEWAPYHALTCAAHAVAAARAHPLLRRRFEWWCRTFAGRFLTPP